MRPRPARRKAFTLLELIVVIVIIGILALLAVPTFSSVIAKSKDATTETSMSALAHDVTALAALDSNGVVTAADISTAAAEMPSMAAGPGVAAAGTETVTTGPSTGPSSGPGVISYALATPATSAGLAVLSSSGDSVYALVTTSSDRVWDAGPVGTHPATGTAALTGPAAGSGSGSVGVQSAGAAVPPIPTGLAAVPANNSVTLTWTASPGATSYQVLRDGSPLPNPPTTASFTDTTALNGTTYTYTVQAAGTGGTSAPSTAVSVTPSAYAAAVVADGAVTYWQMGETSTADPVVDASGHGHWGSYTGPATLAQPPVNSHLGGYSVAMADPNVQVAPTAGSAAATFNADFAMETWFKTTSTNAGYLMGQMSSIQNSSTPYAWDPVVYLDAAGNICFEAYDGGQQYFCTPGTYDTGPWDDVVAQATPTGMQIWVNGTEVASNTVVNTESYPAYFHVGGGYLQSIPQAADWNLVGSIAQASLYPAPLTAAQIDAQYSAATQ